MKFIELKGMDYDSDQIGAARASNQRYAADEIMTLQRKYAKK
jgi:hypothetical protein